MSTIKVVPMSEDHKPTLPGERARVESAGLMVRTNVVRPPDVDDPMDGGGESPAAATTVVHCMRKSESNILGVSRAFFAIPTGGGWHARHRREGTGP